MLCMSVVWTTVDGFMCACSLDTCICCYMCLQSGQLYLMLFVSEVWTPEFDAMGLYSRHRYLVLCVSVVQILVFGPCRSVVLTPVSGAMWVFSLKTSIWRYMFLQCHICIQCHVGLQYGHLYFILCGSVIWTCLFDAMRGCSLDTCIWCYVYLQSGHLYLVLCVSVVSQLHILCQVNEKMLLISIKKKEKYLYI